MQFVIAIVALIAFVALVLITRQCPIVSLDSQIKAVRAGGKTWTPYSGCLRDAQLEGWKWAALRDGRIIEVATMRDTGRRLRELKK
jgi:hypothetical protein